MGESEEVEIARVGDERNQDQEGAADQGCSGLAIEAGAAALGARSWLSNIRAS